MKKTKRASLGGINEQLQNLQDDVLNSPMSQEAAKASAQSSPTTIDSRLESLLAEVKTIVGVAPDPYNNLHATFEVLKTLPELPET